MFATNTKFTWKSGGETGPSEARVAPAAPSQLNAEQDRQHLGFSKVFRWPVPAEQPQPTTVEIVGSFTDWYKVSLAFDKVTKTWQTTLENIKGNHTHRYVILVDGKPSYDKTCDGLALPENPDEKRWQINTARGPRVMLLFSQTK